MSRPKNSGFTLLEIMIALAILSVSLLSFYAAQGGALRASGRAENIQIASRLGRQKLAEKMLVIQQDLARGKLPVEDTDEKEDFEEPFRRFRWRFQVSKIELPVVQPGEEVPVETSGRANAEVATPIPANIQRNMASQVTKKISESIREVTLQVLWDELGEEQSITITTHLARLP